MARVLIADDSIAVRKVAERLLKEAGLVVTLAANAEEAIAQLEKDAPDVVVSDVIMPDKSGYEVCGYIRSHAKLAAIPVLLISGIVNDDVTKQAESCKADGVLKKPFQGSSLQDRVSALLGPKSPKAQEAAAVVSAPTPDVEAAPAVKLEVATPSVQPMPSPFACAEPAVSQPSPFAMPQKESPSIPASTPMAVSPSVSDEEMEATRVRAARADELQHELAAESDRRKELEQALSEAKAQLARMGGMEQALADVQHQQRASETMAQELTIAREQAAELEVVRTRAAAAMHRIEELAKELQDERQKVAELEEMRAGATAAARRLLEVESTIDQQRQELESTRTTLESLQAEVSRRRDDDAERERGFEFALSGERDKVQKLTASLSASQEMAKKARDLEAALTAERAAEAVLVQQVTDLEQRVTRMQALESTLRTTDSQLRAEKQKVEELEARLPEIAQLRAELAGVQASLSSERERNSALAAEAQRAQNEAGRVPTLESALADAKERAERLSQRVTDAESSADAANRRLEEMARKLSQIAGLASKLGSTER
ncbi:MAG: response regulator [Nitrospiraceae bacterium]